MMLFVALMVVASASQLSAQSFTGTNTGAVADGTGNGTCGANRDVQFAVTGATAPVNQVSVNFTGTHSFVGDYIVTLIAPNAASHILFNRVGKATTVGGDYGDGSNLSGTYVFSDVGTLNIWTQANAAGDVANVLNGVYRTQPSGIGSPVATGPAFTSLNTAFAAVPNPNGNWTLRFQDCAGGDTGGVTAAGLTINAAPTSAGIVVGGRAMTPAGRGLASVMVTISGGNLEAPITRMTNPFGYYRFEDIPAGQTYVLSVSSKRFAFSEPVRILNASDSLLDFDFISEEDIFASRDQQ